MILNCLSNSFYLFGNIDSINDEQYEKIRALLLEQRNWVEAYSDFRADYFIATGNCPLALSTNAYIKRIQNTFPFIQFKIPNEGTFVSIESFAIPKESQKDEYVYQFINYLYSKESMVTHYKNFYYYPATLSPIEDLPLSEEEKKLYNYSRAEFSKFNFFKNVIPQQKVRELWVEVKSF